MIFRSLKKKLHAFHFHIVYRLHAFVEVVWGYKREPYMAEDIEWDLFLYVNENLITLRTCCILAGSCFNHLSPALNNSSSDCPRIESADKIAQTSSTDNFKYSSVCTNCEKFLRIKFFTASSTSLRLKNRARLAISTQLTKLFRIFEKMNGNLKAKKWSISTLSL